MTHSSLAEPSPSVAPLRCALLGLTPRGDYHAEVCEARRDLELVVVAYSGPVAARDAEGSCLELLTPKLVSRDELLRRSDLDWVIVASPLQWRATDAIAVMRAGHDVIVEVPIAATVSEVDAVLQAARDTGRRCRVCLAPRDDADFSRACTVLRSGQLGKLRTATLTLRQAAAFVLPHILPATERVSDEEQLGVLDVFGWRYLEQLVRLISAPIVRVFGLINQGQLCFDSLTSCGVTTARETGFLAVIEFASGAVAHVEVDLASSVSANGAHWVLQGDRGGYAAGKQSLLEADGEVFEVDVVPTRKDSSSDLLAPTSPEEQDSELGIIAAVAQLVAAIKQSSSTREIVSLPATHSEFSRAVAYEASR